MYASGKQSKYTTTAFLITIKTTDVSLNHNAMFTYFVQNIQLTLDVMKPTDIRKPCA